MTRTLFQGLNISEGVNDDVTTQPPMTLCPIVQYLGGSIAEGGSLEAQIEQDVREDGQSRLLFDGRLCLVVATGAPLKRVKYRPHVLLNEGLFDLRGR